MPSIELKGLWIIHFPPLDTFHCTACSHAPTTFLSTSIHRYMYMYTGIWRTVCRNSDSMYDYICYYMTMKLCFIFIDSLAWRYRRQSAKQILLCTHKTQVNTRFKVRGCGYICIYTKYTIVGLQAWLSENWCFVWNIHIYFLSIAVYVSFKCNKQANTPFIILLSESNQWKYSFPCCPFHTVGEIHLLWRVRQEVKHYCAIACKLLTHACLDSADCVQECAARVPKKCAYTSLSRNKMTFNYFHQCFLAIHS